MNIVFTPGDSTEKIFPEQLYRKFPTTESLISLIDDPAANLAAWDTARSYKAGAEVSHMSKGWRAVEDTTADGDAPSDTNGSWAERKAQLVVSVINYNRGIKRPDAPPKPDISGFYDLKVGWYGSNQNQLSDSTESSEGAIWPNSYNGERESITFDIPANTRAFVLENIETQNLVFSNGGDPNIPENVVTANSRDIYCALDIAVDGIFVSDGRKLSVLQPPSVNTIRVEGGGGGSGGGLSPALLAKLNGIEDGAEVNVPVSQVDILDAVKSPRDSDDRGLVIGTGDPTTLDGENQLQLYSVVGKDFFGDAGVSSFADPRDLGPGYYLSIETFVSPGDQNRGILHQKGYNTLAYKEGGGARVLAEDSKKRIDAIGTPTAISRTWRRATQRDQYNQWGMYTDTEGTFTEPSETSRPYHERFYFKGFTPSTAAAVTLYVSVPKGFSSDDIRVRLAADLDNPTNNDLLFPNGAQTWIPVTASDFWGATASLKQQNLEDHLAPGADYYKLSERLTYSDSPRDEYGVEIADRSYTYSISAGTATDQTARDAAAAAQAAADAADTEASGARDDASDAQAAADANTVLIGANTDAVNSLTHLTRDLHVGKVEHTWTDSADSVGDLFWTVPVNGAITLTDANFNNEGASTTIPASNSARTTYVFARFPAATNISNLRIHQGSTYIGSNQWGLAADEGVTVPNNDTFQYWMAAINPQETAEETWVLQQRNDIEHTRYDGSLGGEGLIQSQNEDRFSAIEHLTRDLHVNHQNPDWENATDDLIDLYGVRSSSEDDTLTDANFNNNGAVILIASDAATTVFVRLPAAANYLRYRVVFPNGLTLTGNQWTSVTGPDETTYQYWRAGSVDSPGGSITKAQFHEVVLGDTTYTGSGSVPSGGVSGQVLAKISADPYDIGWTTAPMSNSSGDGGTGGTATPTVLYEDMTAHTWDHDGFRNITLSQAPTAGTMLQFNLKSAPNGIMANTIYMSSDAFLALEVPNTGATGYNSAWPSPGNTAWLGVAPAAVDTAARITYTVGGNEWSHLTFLFVRRQSDTSMDVLYSFDGVDRSATLKIEEMPNGSASGGGGSSDSGSSGFRAYAPLTTPDDVTTDVSIPSSGTNPAIYKLLDAHEFAGPINKDLDFFTEWEGSVILEMANASRALLWMHTTHAFGENFAKAFVHSRPYAVDAPGGARISVSLGVFDSVSQVPIGTFRSTTITEEDLALPSKITYELEIQSFQRKGTNQNTNTLKYLSFNNIDVISFQIGAGNTGGVDSTARTAIANIPTVLAGTREPRSSDGSDKDFWVYGGDNGSLLSISENVEGAWVEIGRATDDADDVSHLTDNIADLHHITRDLHSPAAVNAWEDASDSDGDLYQALASSTTNLTDANFNGNGAEITISTNASTQVYVRLPIAEDYTDYRIAFSDGFARSREGHLWTTPSYPAATSTTYQYWRADGFTNYGGGEVKLQKREAVLDVTTYTGRGSVPVGGTSGQVLSKSSADDYDLEWSTVSGGGSGTDATARAAAAAAQSTADAALSRSGGTMTGKITLDGAPTANLHAATKKYVDDNIGSGGDGGSSGDGGPAELEEYLSSKQSFRVTNQNFVFTGITKPDTIGDDETWFIRLDESATSLKWGQPILASLIPTDTSVSSGDVKGSHGIRFDFGSDGGGAGEFTLLWGAEGLLMTGRSNSRTYAGGIIIYRMTGGGSSGGAGRFLTQIGESVMLALSADTVADTGIDMPASVASDEVWALKVGNERYDDLAFFFPTEIVEGNGAEVGTTLNPDSGAGDNAGVTIRSRRANSTQQDTIVLAQDSTGNIVIASSHSNLDPIITLYRVNVGGGSGGGAQLKDFDSLPDVASYEEGDLVAVDENWYKLGTTDETTPNLFAGDVGRDVFNTTAGERWRGISSSQSPNGFSTDGEFTANPDNTLTLLLASSSRHIRVAMKRSVYEAAKGSTFSPSDHIAIRVTMADGSTTDEAVLAYYNQYERETHYIIWQHRHASDNYNLYSEEAGNAITIEFFTTSGSTPAATTTPLFTHEVALKHWLLWPGGDDPTEDGRTALNLAQANAARLDALDMHVDGVAEPIHSQVYDENTNLRAPTASNSGDLAVSQTFSNILTDDLIVIDWERCDHLNHHDEHVVPGSTTDSGRMYMYPRNFDNTEWNGEFIYALDRAILRNGSADPLNSWIVGTILFSGSTLTFGLHLQQGGSRPNRNLKPQAGFRLSMRIYRNTALTVSSSSPFKGIELGRLVGHDSNHLGEQPWTSLATGVTTTDGPDTGYSHWLSIPMLNYITFNTGTGIILEMSRTGVTTQFSQVFIPWHAIGNWDNRGTSYPMFGGSWKSSGTDNDDRIEVRGRIHNGRIDLQAACGGADDEGTLHAYIAT